MTRIQNDRGPLDKILSGLVDGVVVTDVLLLAGGPGSDAEKVYLRAQGMQWDAFERYVLIENSGVLEAAERNAWFDGATDRYTVFRIATKTPFPKGPVSALFMPPGQANAFLIRMAFANVPAGNPGGHP